MPKKKLAEANICTDDQYPLASAPQPTVGQRPHEAQTRLADGGTLQVTIKKAQPPVFSSRQTHHDDQHNIAAADSTPAATLPANTHGKRAAAPLFSYGRRVNDLQPTPAAADSTSVDGQTCPALQSTRAIDGPNLNDIGTRIHATVVDFFTSTGGTNRRESRKTRKTAGGTLVSDSQAKPDTQVGRAVTDSTPADDHVDAYPPPVLVDGFLRDPVLGVLADVVDDLESVRVANANRVRQLTRTATDKDGEERGFGLTLDHPEVAKLAVTVAALELAEKDAIKNLQRALRKHPLAGFQKRHKGIGEKQLARLLAVIGDPYWNDLHSRPRTVSELWAYCGLHVINASGGGQVSAGTQSQLAAAGSQPHAEGQAVPGTQLKTAFGIAPRRTRGQKSNWSEAARKRVWVIAAAMPKFPGGQYESTYRQARLKYADAVHSVDCVRCGPSGKPALAGTPLSDGHKHARAIRITAKTILRDLWIEARDLHNLQESE